jgi:hypothetical protein
MKKQMTIREILRLLFDSKKYAVVGEDEMRNHQCRNFLLSLNNLDKTYNVIDEGSHLLIWN